MSMLKELIQEKHSREKSKSNERGVCPILRGIAHIFLIDRYLNLSVPLRQFNQDKYLQYMQYLFENKTVKQQKNYYCCTYHDRLCFFVNG
jgi:hypothetical protein